MNGKHKISLIQFLYFLLEYFSPGLGGNTYLDPESCTWEDDHCINVECSQYRFHIDVQFVYDMQALYYSLLINVLGRSGKNIATKFNDKSPLVKQCWQKQFIIWVGFPLDLLQWTFNWQKYDELFWELWFHLVSNLFLVCLTGIINIFGWGELIQNSIC